MHDSKHNSRSSTATSSSTTSTPTTMLPRQYQVLLPPRPLAHSTSSSRRNYSDPYKILDIPYDATLPQIREAIGTRMCQIDIDPDDDSGEGHQLLINVSLAREILEFEPFRRKVLDCVNICYSRPTPAPLPTAEEILGVRANSIGTKIHAAYLERREEWKGYERVAGIVFFMFDQAQEKLNNEWRKRMDLKASKRKLLKLQTPDGSDQTPIPTTETTDDEKTS